MLCKEKAQNVQWKINGFLEADKVSPQLSCARPASGKTAESQKPWRRTSTERKTSEILEKQGDIKEQLKNKICQTFGVQSYWTGGKTEQFTNCARRAFQNQSW